MDLKVCTKCAQHHVLVSMGSRIGTASTDHAHANQCSPSCTDQHVFGIAVRNKYGRGNSLQAAACTSRAMWRNNESKPSADKDDPSVTTRSLIRHSFDPVAWSIPQRAHGGPSGSGGRIAVARHSPFATASTSMFEIMRVAVEHQKAYSLQSMANQCCTCGVGDGGVPSRARHQPAHRRAVCAWRCIQQGQVQLCSRQHCKA